MKCLNCNKNKSVKVEPFGYTYCAPCNARLKKYKVAPNIEIATPHIKESRKAYADDILQKYRGNTPSLEYIKKYGTKGFAKDEVKNARNVWGSYYEDKTERYNKKV